MADTPDIDRKELKGPDAFFESVGRVNRYLQENSVLVLATAGALVLVFVGGISWSAYATRRAEKTADAFLRATDAIDLNSPATARAALATVAEESGSTYGLLARLYTADLDARAGEHQQALANYDAVAEQAEQDYVRQVALMGKAFSLEMTGNEADAAQAYAQAGALEGPHREQALRGQLRAAIAATDQDLSRAAIERLLELYPESADADQLARKLEALGG